MGPTKLLPGIDAIGAALWISGAKILVFGDVHIGYEEALSKQGYIVPQVQFKETVERIRAILNEVKPKMIVINGDLKHEFGDISDQEWMETSKFLDLLSEGCEKIVLVKGNHDTILGPIAKKKNLEVKDFYIANFRGAKILITHGDKIREEKEARNADLIVIGNEHAAVTLHEGPKSEKYKCFLLGKWKGQKLLAMPSFLPTIEGTDVRREDLLSPYLHQNLGNFEVFIVGDKVYHFGKLKNVR